MALGLNFIARWRKFRCPSFFISLPVGVNFVARRYMYPLPVVFYFVARENLKQSPWFFMRTAVDFYVHGRALFRY